ncbi:actin-binding Rho-activating protein isoform X2 [Hyalella azteca]|uniref:Actin-binding Rho-activating protein isoform X2 n=1 Tax=Hyalella azteca TaxID=294128 RepID=A0A8B7NK40_HYAAZ|nr:actin-binding Rho-activating protein isoform X2 [Hyalella azteca]
MPVTLRLFHDGVSSLTSKFNARVKQHADYQSNCAFSDWQGPGSTYKLTKYSENYGRPDPNSKSAARAREAQLSIMTEIRHLCYMIFECAEWKSKDGFAAITFGRLFSIYKNISDKLVGTLLRARKHGFLHFEGEMLYQRRDDHKIIELSSNINSIRARFGERPLVAGGGEVQCKADDSPGR